MTDRAASKRIVVVGGGIAGLSIALRLAEAGLAVTLLEASRLGSAASSRNQGWLHSGAWFAPTDRELARMCHESLKQTLRFCPDCVEPQNIGMAYLFSKPTTDASRWIEAWSEADIFFEELPMSKLFSLIPDLDRSQVRCAFLLPDCSIRMDVLLAHLTVVAQKAGAEIRTQTPAVRLLFDGDRVTGVAIRTGKEISGRLVILATGAEPKLFWSACTKPEAGRQSSYTCVSLKTHLVAVAPEVSTLPFCVVDREGFNHTPHGAKSIFGLNRWCIASNPTDRQVVPGEVDRLWSHINEFFPNLGRDKCEVAEWAGTTVQAMQIDQVEPGLAPRPTVIDHSQENPRVENLLSVFPGRATLWPQLAEETCRLVCEKLDKTPI